MDYYYLLKYSAQPEDWLNVMDALAVQETYFWREIDQLRAVVTLVVPELRRDERATTVANLECAVRDGRGAADAWRCCSPKPGGSTARRFELLASDASPSAIARARLGQFGPAVISQSAAGSARQILRRPGRIVERVGGPATAGVV